MTERCQVDAVTDSQVEHGQKALMVRWQERPGAGCWENEHETKYDA